MRMFITGSTGTGGVLGPIALDPPYPTDPDTGLPSTFAYRPDPIRPDVAIAGPYTCAPLNGRGNRLHFLVIARDLVAAPAGTYDLGDPTSPADMARVISKPEERTLETTFDAARNTFRDMTVLGVSRWVLVNEPTFAARFDGVPTLLF